MLPLGKNASTIVVGFSISAENIFILYTLLFWLRAAIAGI